MKHLVDFRTYEAQYYSGEELNEGFMSWISGIADKVTSIFKKEPEAKNMVNKNADAIALNLEEKFGIDVNEPLEKEATIKKIIEVLKAKYSSKAVKFVSGVKDVVLGVAALIGVLLGFSFTAAGYFAAAIGATMADENQWYVTAALIIWGIISAGITFSVFSGNDGQKWHQRQSGVSDAEAHSSGYQTRY